jgi:hypothetical protein
LGFRIGGSEVSVLLGRDPAIRRHIPKEQRTWHSFFANNFWIFGKYHPKVAFYRPAGDMTYWY